VVIIPVIFKGDDEKSIKDKSEEIYAMVKKAGIRVELDDREHHNPGFKYNHWEL